MQRLNRRNFTKRSIAVVAGVSAAMSSTLSAAARRRTRKNPPDELEFWVLNPEHGAGSSCGDSSDHGDCRGCSACHSHAENKLFATEEAANAIEGRAHPYCKCRAEVGGTLPRNTWNALFGRTSSPEIHSVDLRHPSTRRILERVS